MTKCYFIDIKSFHKSITKNSNNPTEKWAKPLKDFLGKGTQIRFKCMKRCSNSLIKEEQIKYINISTKIKN